MSNPTLNPLIQYLRNQFIIGPFPRAQLNPTRTHMNKDQLSALEADLESFIEDDEDE